MVAVLPGPFRISQAIRHNKQQFRLPASEKGNPLAQPSPFQGEKIHFVTGRLAEPALRRVAAGLETDYGVTISIQVMPITVAALMSPAWIARHIEIPAGCDRVVLPGYCDGDLQPLREKIGSLPVVTGPRDLRRLPELFGGRAEPRALDDYSIEIIAEINHAPRWPVADLLTRADQLRDDGANVIDIGCQPGTIWSEIGTVVGELIDRGLRVSVDSLEPAEIGPAVAAGAELVLSVNSGNRRAAVDWGCEVVVIPDQPDQWLQMADTIEYLSTRGVPLRIDPILEPIGAGLAASLARFIEARRIWPDAPMMMGIGNLTELTDVDSAGLNFLLMAICEELDVGSVLTTEVINWARSSVRECDIARRLVRSAVTSGVPPKNLDSRLVCLRDPRLLESGLDELRELAAEIRDNNYRIAVAGDSLHLLGAGGHWSHRDAFELFHQLIESGRDQIDPGHAFYLGYEMCKATIALQLGKQYEQDEALDWGYLTVDEPGHRRLKRNRKTQPPGS